MRAAYANGVLAAFEQNGLTDWDAVYGTSAGGALAAWFSAGQAAFAQETWAYVQDERIMSYKRWLLRRGPLLDHDRLFEIVYADEHPLDTQAVQAAEHPVIVTATEVETGQGHYQDIRDGPVLDWLKATGRLPMAAGNPVEIDGTAYLDGGLADPVPIQKAIDDGHEEIVLLLNRPQRERAGEPWLVTRLLGRKYPALSHLIEEHATLWNEAVDIAHDPPGGVQVHILQPSQLLDLARLSRDLDDLDHALALGRSDGEAFIETYRDGSPQRHNGHKGEQKNPA